MTRKLFLNLILLLVLFVLNSGCSVNRATATLDPTLNLETIKSLYVTKLPPDQRGINVLIADKLKTKGFVVNTGDGDARPSDVDIVVTYEDKWMWDITNYMLELTITFRDPETDFPLASGNSFHTSLSRKSPEEMVDEVIENILNQ